MPGYSIARLMRDYKISLLHCFCASVCKSNLVQACRTDALGMQSLFRGYMNLFPRDLPLFRLEAAHPKDTLHVHEYYDQHSDFEEAAYMLNTEVRSLLTVPSVKTLMGIGVAAEDKQLEEVKGRVEFDLDMFRKNRLEEIDLRRKQRLLVNGLMNKAREEDTGYRQTRIGKVAMLLENVLHMFEMHYFFSKLNIAPLESFQLQQAAFRYLPFWTSTH